MSADDPIEVSNLRVRALLDAVPEGGSILDVGCVQHDAEAADSDEWVHDHLHRIGDVVLGIDYLEDEVAALSDRGYDVVAADAQNFDLGREFDTVVAGELIEHLSDVGGFLDSVRRHLLPDGRLILTTPNPWAFHRFRRALVEDDVPCNPEHTCWFDARTLRQVLDRHGFDVESLEFVRPSTAGVSRLLFDLGRDAVGGTSLLAVARPSQSDEQHPNTPP